MARGDCPNPNPDCPYFERPGGCFSDQDHLYFPKSDYCGIVELEFRELPENKEQICRWEHEERNTPDKIPDKPPVDFMIGAVRTAFESGIIHLSVRKRKKLGLM